MCLYREVFKELSSPLLCGLMFCRYNDSSAVIIKLHVGVDLQRRNLLIVKTLPHLQNVDVGRRIFSYAMRNNIMLLISVHAEGPIHFNFYCMSQHKEIG